MYVMFDYDVADHDTAPAGAVFEIWHNPSGKTVGYADCAEAAHELIAELERNAGRTA